MLQTVSTSARGLQMRQEIHLLVNNHKKNKTHSLNEQENLTNVCYEKISKNDCHLKKLHSSKTKRFLTR